MWQASFWFLYSLTTRNLNYEWHFCYLFVSSAALEKLYQHSRTHHSWRHQINLSSNNRSNLEGWSFAFLVSISGLFLVNVSSLDESVIIAPTE